MRTYREGDEIIRVGDVAYATGNAPARVAPGGSYVLVNGKKLVRHKGFRFIVKELKQAADGTYWAKTGNWYPASQLGLWHVGSPVPGYGVNYPFGVPDKGYIAKYHTGEDHAAPQGSNIVAVTAGTIRFTGWDKSYGNYTILASDNGHEYLYAHQHDVTVRTGQQVFANQVIGHVGETGNATGPHCHFEMSKGSRWAYGDVQQPRW